MVACLGEVLAEVCNILGSKAGHQVLVQAVQLSFDILGQLNINV